MSKFKALCDNEARTILKSMKVVQVYFPVESKDPANRWKYIRTFRNKANALKWLRQKYNIGEVSARLFIQEF